jgi:hypothetical protein
VATLRFDAWLFRTDPPLATWITPVVIGSSQTAVGGFDSHGGHPGDRLEPRLVSRDRAVHNAKQDSPCQCFPVAEFT